ncbi:MAG: tRNA (cytidine(34)-2'-O)-methyltransferase [Acidobacteriota bacterium]
MTPDLHIVLVAPEIPWNTGNVGRTCLAVGATLHLVRPLGFQLDQRHLRRAGLDYWQHVDVTTWTGWDAFEDALPSLGSPWFFTAEADRTIHDIERSDAAEPRVLVFGSESTGFPPPLRARFRDHWPDRLVAIPMIAGPVRSLNLSTAVAVAAYEIRRQLGFPISTPHST